LQAEHSEIPADAFISDDPCRFPACFREPAIAVLRLLSLFLAPMSQQDVKQTRFLTQPKCISEEIQAPAADPRYHAGALSGKIPQLRKPGLRSDQKLNAPTAFNPNSGSNGMMHSLSSPVPVSRTSPKRSSTINSRLPVLPPS
jgi:hypothetical protein